MAVPMEPSPIKASVCCAAIGAIDLRFAGHRLCLMKRRQDRYLLLAGTSNASRLPREANGGGAMDSHARGKAAALGRYMSMQMHVPPAVGKTGGAMAWKWGQLPVCVSRLSVRKQDQRQKSM